MHEVSPYIRCPRQKRAILALLENENVIVDELGVIIGARNPAQTILDLRRQGFENIIRTERFSVFDRDGKTCYPGFYYIPYEQRTFAEVALKTYEAKAIEAAQELARSQTAFFASLELPF